jgi:hypothetical protein
MIKSIPVNKEHLSDLIHHAEHTVGFKMNMEDHDFLLIALDSLIKDAISKFIAGCKEHNEGANTCFEKDVDHAAEINNEVIDLFFYSFANKRRQCKKQKT